MRTEKGYWGVPWSADEVEYLRANYATMRTKDIVEKLGRSYNAVVLRAKIEGLTSRHRSAKTSLVPGYFKVIDTPEKAYLLGLISADGCISARNQLALALSEKDAELVEFARDCIAPGGRITGYVTKTGSRMVAFKVQNAELAEDLAQWGIRPAKTLAMHWPVTLSPEMGRSYLHGYFDGDGSLGTDGIGRWALVGGSPSFLASVQEFVLAETGIRVGGPYQDKRHKHAWSIVATGAPVRELDAWLQQDGLGLARKRFTV